MLLRIVDRVGGEEKGRTNGRKRFLLSTVGEERGATGGKTVVQPAAGKEGGGGKGGALREGGSR